MLQGLASCVQVRLVVGSFVVLAFRGFGIPELAMLLMFSSWLGKELNLEGLSNG